MIIQGKEKDCELWDPVLLYLPALTTLELTNIQFPALTIQMFRDGCSQLQHVTARYQGSKRNSSGSSPELMAAGSGAHGTYRLDTLVLDHVTIGWTWIETTLNKSPGLTELQLLHVFTDNPDEEQRRSSDDPCFISRVYKSCPTLRVLQWNLTDYMGSVSNFHTFTSREPNEENNVFEALVRYTRIRDLGVPSALLSPKLWQTIPTFPNLLTSLSIFHNPTFLYEEPSNITAITSISRSKLLHRYLCSSPQLVHLHASSFMFDDRLLIIDADQDWSEGGSPIWACRSLVTLSLGFGNWLDTHHPPDINEDPTVQEVIRTIRSVIASSRIVFGYLAQVCPRLTRLWISRRWIDCTSDGGMVLLTNMELLERLEIATESQIRVHFWDFIWLYTSPSTLVKLTSHMSSNESKVQRILRSRYEWLGCMDCAEADHDLLVKFRLPRHLCEPSHPQTPRSGLDILALKFQLARSPSNNSYVSLSSSWTKDPPLIAGSSKVRVATKPSTKRTKPDKHTIPYDSWPHLGFIATYETHLRNLHTGDLKDIIQQLRPNVTFESYNSLHQH